MIEGAKMMAHYRRVGRAALLEQNLNKAAMARTRQRAQAGRRCSPLASGALLRPIHRIEGRTAKASAPAIEQLPRIAAAILPRLLIVRE
jgi:hypothetical protein